MSWNMRNNFFKNLIWLSVHSCLVYMRYKLLNKKIIVYYSCILALLKLFTTHLLMCYLLMRYLLMYHILTLLMRYFLMCHILTILHSPRTSVVKFKLDRTELSWTDGLGPV